MKQKIILSFLSVLLVWFVSACVTVNVYFPAAAAEKAADKIIQKVWGQPEEGSEDEPSKESETPLQDPSDADEMEGDVQSVREQAVDILIGRALSSLTPAAHAQANINVSTPAIKRLEAQMAARHGKLKPYYDNGAIGLTHDGLITVRDAKAIPLSARNKVKNDVASENQDRLALYREIAKANKQPEWEAQIRETFATRWITQAKSGWWYQNKQGAWSRK